MKTLYGSIIITYRCNAKCNMCDCFHHPTDPQEEIPVSLLEKLPQLDFANITGGEPFIRQDIEEIVCLLKKKAKRIVISTNGFFSERIIRLFKKHNDIGVRISIEGLSHANDSIRGIQNGFDRGLKTLLQLSSMGVKDIGFGMTVQASNALDLMSLYQLSKALKMEFATAVVHNSFYFRKTNNIIEKPVKVAKQFESLIQELLNSHSPKKWFRAYFNHGLIQYLFGKPRLLSCEMGTNGFFLDPFGDVLPCNGSDQKWSMGNLHHQTWEELWNSPKAKEMRETVKNCRKNCWMIGSAAPAMKDNLWIPLKWVLKHKLKKKYSASDYFSKMKD